MRKTRFKFENGMTFGKGQIMILTFDIHVASLNHILVVSMGASMIRELEAAIIRDGKVPSDWEQSFIVCLYKGKGDALETGKYRGLKLTEQVMKVLERIVDGLIGQVVSTDDSQFGFVPGRGTTDAIFVVRQLQEKYLAANNRLYMAFVDLEKAFDRVPC